MLKKHLSKYVMASRLNDYRFAKLNRAKSLNPPTSYDDLHVSALREQDYKKLPRIII